MGEKMREKCLSTVEHEKTLIDNEFPKQKDLTNRIFVEILDFIILTYTSQIIGKIIIKIKILTEYLIIKDTDVF